MRILLFILPFFVGEQLYSQDTTVNWINNIDTSTFTIHYNKKDIPLEFYSIIGIEKLKDIVSANKKYSKGCDGILPHKRLNWIANDKNNHWVISISYGGFANGTKYYFIDKDNGNWNKNIFYFNGANTENLPFSLVILKLKKRQYTRGFEN